MAEIIFVVVFMCIGGLIAGGIGAMLGLVAAILLMNVR